MVAALTIEATTGDHAHSPAFLYHGLRERVGDAIFALSPGGQTGSLVNARQAHNH